MSGFGCQISGVRFQLSFTLSLTLLAWTAPSVIAQAHDPPQDRNQAIPVRPAAWIGDHMVLAAGRPVSISGTASPGTEVTVEFVKQKKRAVSNQQGQWKVVLEPMSASVQPRTLTVSSTGTSLRFSDVLVGDIWLCAGQSNMGFSIKASEERDAAKKEIGEVEVRYFNGSSWAKLTSGNIEGVSAVGAWFAMEMARRQDKPMGLFVAARGGTSIEGWIPKGGFPDTEHGRRMERLAEDPEVLEAARADARDSRPYGQHRLAKWGLGRAAPASMFEQRLGPFADLPIRGVVWYQGESNALSTDSSAREYRFWLRSLIVSWRVFFGSSDMPFMVIQLPEYDPGTEAVRAGWTEFPEAVRARWAEIQEAQAAAAQELGGVCAVKTKGLGDLEDIHPRRKKEVGRRAAEAACRQFGTPRTMLDWRDADRSWYAKVDDSGPGGHFNDNAQAVMAADGTWICTWTTGKHEGSGDMQVVYSLSRDQGVTWSKKKPIEPATQNNTSAYGYLFKSPVNGRIFSIYRFHDNKKVMEQLRKAGQKPPRGGGHFRDTAGDIAFRYSDDHGKTWSERHFIPTRRTRADNPKGPLCGWFYGIGPVVIGDHVWFTGNKYKATITTGHGSSETSPNTWETWFWKSPNMHTEQDPEKITWENKPDGDVGIVPDQGLKYWVESSLVALKDPNHLYCVARNRYTGVLGQSYSTDGGDTWQTPPSAAEYWDGSGALNNPKAGPMLKQLSDGTYLLTFYNDRARPDNKVHWTKLFDRSPLWCAVGWPDGNVLKFSQPEILLYNDEDAASSSGGKNSSIYAPFLFEADGKVFTVLTNKKTDVQIAHIPWSLINGLKHQRTTKKVAKEGLVVSLSQKDIAANPRISLPDHRFRFGDLSRGESFSVECWVEAKEHTPNATILDTRNGQGHGIWVGLAEKGKLAIELTDTSNRRERAHTAEDAFSEGKLHHVVINVDGASDVITIIVDGIISGDNPRMNFKQISRDLTSVHGTGKAYLGEPSAEVKSSKRALSGTLRHLRIYDRYLLTSEAIANYRAGIAQ